VGGKADKSGEQEEEGSYFRDGHRPKSLVDRERNQADPHYRKKEKEREMIRKKQDSLPPHTGGGTTGDKPGKRLGTRLKILADLSERGEAVCPGANGGKKKERKPEKKREYTLMYAPKIVKTDGTVAEVVRHVLPAKSISR